MKTQIKRIGNSRGVVIPSAIMKTLSIKDGDLFEIKIDKEGNISLKKEIIEPLTLESLFADYSGTYDEDIVFDDVKGREVW